MTARSCRSPWIVVVYIFIGCMGLYGANAEGNELGGVSQTTQGKIVQTAYHQVTYYEQDYSVIQLILGFGIELKEHPGLVFLYNPRKIDLVMLGLRTEDGQTTSVNCKHVEIQYTPHTRYHHRMSEEAAAKYRDVTSFRWIK